jgi:hypothetical protein
MSEKTSTPLTGSPENTIGTQSKNWPIGSEQRSQPPAAEAISSQAYRESEVIMIDEEAGIGEKSRTGTLKYRMKELSSSMAEMKLHAQKFLERSVKDFNADLQAWADATGCQANFNWSYRDGAKQLYVTDISYPVYTQRGIEDSDVQAVLKKFADSQEDLPAESKGVDMKECFAE